MSSVTEFTLQMQEDLRPISGTSKIKLIRLTFWVRDLLDYKGNDENSVKYGMGLGQKARSGYTGRE